MQAEAESKAKAEAEYRQRKAEELAAAREATARGEDERKSAGGAGVHSASYTSARDISTTGSDLNKRIMKGLKRPGGEGGGEPEIAPDTGMSYSQISELPDAQQLEQLRVKETKLQKLGGRGEELKVLAKRKGELKQLIRAER
jgi:hypothetical protein